MQNSNFFDTSEHPWRGTDAQCSKPREDIGFEI
jgi:hypothetical protein